MRGELRVPLINLGIQGRADAVIDGQPRSGLAVDPHQQCQMRPRR